MITITFYKIICEINMFFWIHRNDCLYSCLHYFLFQIGAIFQGLFFREKFVETLVFVFIFWATFINRNSSLVGSNYWLGCKHLWIKLSFEKTMILWFWMVQNKFTWIERVYVPPIFYLILRIISCLKHQICSNLI